MESRLSEVHAKGISSSRTVLAAWFVPYRHRDSRGKAPSFILEVGFPKRPLLADLCEKQFVKGNGLMVRANHGIRKAVASHAR